MLKKMTGAECGFASFMMLFANPFRVFSNDRVVLWVLSYIFVMYCLVLSVSLRACAPSNLRSDYLRGSDLRLRNTALLRKVWVWFPFGFDTPPSASLLVRVTSP